MKILVFEDGEVSAGTAASEVVPEVPVSSDEPVTSVPADDTGQIPSSPPQQNVVPKTLPPPNRSMYDYRIVPWYIPIGQRYYSQIGKPYFSEYFNDIIFKTFEDGEFDFSDGEFGLFLKIQNVCITAGSETGRLDIVKIKIGRRTYFRFFKTAKSARRMFFKLKHLLQNQEDLNVYLKKFKFHLLRKKSYYAF